VDTNPGNLASPFATITRAQTAATSGDTVYLRGGTYFLNNSHLTATNNPWAIVNNLTNGGISYIAYPGERPIFNFSNVQPPNFRVTAFRVATTNCVFKGFEVVGVQVTIQAGQASNTQSECFRVTGSRNRFEQLSMHDGMGIGWYLTAGSSNLVLNCDAYNNRGLDSLSMGNVDGFGAHPNSASGTGNVFRGCRAWFNSDDGFDLINAEAAVVIENCWAFYNGYFTNFTSSGGDANGFKSGGYGVSGGSVPNPVPRHVTRFCLAVRNRANGFYANHHIGGLDWVNNTAYRNSVNYNMLCNFDGQSPTNDVPGFGHVMKNNLGYRGTTEVSNLGSSNDVTFNYFSVSVTVATNDFLSLAESQLTAPRQANGDLPLIAFARLADGSDLIDQGTPAGFAFHGAAPDLGAFEHGAVNVLPTMNIVQSESSLVFSGTSGWPNGTNHLLTASDLQLPLSQWTPVATNRFDSIGNYVFTNGLSEAPTQQFYRLKIP
jgi:hypothetical protein